jgi:hypothetical protein
MNIRKKILAFDEGMGVYSALLEDEEDIQIPFAISMYVTLCKINELLHQYIADLDRNNCKEALGIDFDKMTQLTYWMKNGKLERDMEALSKVTLKEHGYELTIKGFKPETTMDLFQAIVKKILEMIELIKEVDRRFMEAPISLYGNFYEHQKRLCERQAVETAYAGYKRDVGAPTYDLLKDKQIFEVSEMLKKKILRFTQEPSQREIDGVDIDKIRLHLPLDYVVPEEFRKCCARFKRFCSCDGNILRIDHDKYGNYLFQYYHDLTPEERQIFIALDLMLDLIHKDMETFPKGEMVTEAPALEANLEGKTVDERVKMAIDGLKQEELIEHLYDYAWVMGVMNETKDLPSFDSPQSFLTYLSRLDVAPLPEVSNIKKEYGRIVSKFPNWTILNKDTTETTRRINVAKRFLNLYRNA